MEDVNKSLLHSVKQSNHRKVRRLLDDGADPNYIDVDEDISPMHEAVRRGTPESLCLLLRYNGNPNLRLKDGTTPVHEAAVQGLADCMQILLTNGGDPYITDQDGFSALDFAFMYRHEDVVLVIQENTYERSLQEEQSLTPKYTLKRLSSEIVNSQGQPPQTYPAVQNCEVNSDQRESNFPVPSPDSDIEPIHSTKQPSYDSSKDTKEALRQFFRRRRSSGYLETFQKQVDHFIPSGRRTHLMDVTSPDHPFIDMRHSSSDDSVTVSADSVDCATNDSVDSLCLHLSSSTITDQSSDSLTFVTCNGEDLESMKLQTLDISTTSSSSSEDSTVYQTVKKNPKFIKDQQVTPFYETVTKNPNIVEKQKVNTRNEKRCKSLFKASELDSTNGSDTTTICNSSSGVNKSKQNGLNRSRKYCKRSLEPPVASQDLFKTNMNDCENGYSEVANDPDFIKCDFCNREAETNTDVGTVCRVCAELGCELDRLVSQSQDCVDYGNMSRNKSCVKSGSQKSLTNRSRLKHLYETDSANMNSLSEQFEKTELIVKDTEKSELNLYDSEQSDAVVRDSRMTKVDVKDNKAYSNCIRTEKAKVVDKIHVPINTQSCAVKNLDGSNRLDDSLLSTVSSTVKELDKGCIWNDSLLTVDDTFLDKKSLSPPYKPETLSSIKTIDRIGADSVKANCHNNDIGRMSNFNSIPSNGNDELWHHIQDCKHKKLANRDQTVNLDTGFYGRESMNSSIYSDGSTIDYVYTDIENGIQLVERHLPSLCGSQGSTGRRSFDSQLSSKSDVDRASNGRVSDTSQDTVLYNWRDNAMLMPSDSGRGDSGQQTNSQTSQSYKTRNGSYTSSTSTCSTPPLSQELLQLNNEEIRKRLNGHGDNPGPVTTTTRQRYLRRLSQYDNDPDYKLQLTNKVPDYPPELRHALAGNLDLSDMPSLELKMVAKFQNPDRLVTWREGTLKSSFNYILLDPRITKNLPNRSCNMSDKDVFQTFITAIFYIGKGKRARPYSHLYEAIKQQKKKADKVSKKVERILDIWHCGLGVVSLHCYQSVIPVEAYTREACMVDGIGLHHLTNMKRGDYYGVSKDTFSMKEKKMMGVYLLKKALQIFLAEGERQIAPLDIIKD